MAEFKMEIIINGTKYNIDEAKKLYLELKSVFEPNITYPPFDGYLQRCLPYATTTDNVTIGEYGIKTLKQKVE